MINRYRDFGHPIVLKLRFSSLDVRSGDAKSVRHTLFGIIHCLRGTESSFL